jgi:hypothetical protein
MIPKIRQTVEDLERVRRFVSQCLNIDLQKWERKNPRPQVKEAIEKWEAERKGLEVDWGTIPGNDKPFLMQPGAEKILFWLQLKPTYINRETELPNGHIEMVSRVIVKHKKTNEEVFQGPECSCTTMETNFRYIWADSERNPTEQEKEPLKMSGMGRNRLKKEWKRGRIVGEKWVWQVRIDNPNIYNERNKVRQQGQKRALVKCTRNMGALSEIFTQPPEEWDINPVDTDGSPETDMDYTAGGRRIVQHDGTAPSGAVADQRLHDQIASQRLLAEKLGEQFCEKHRCPESKCPSDEHTPEENDASVARLRARDAKNVKPTEPKPAAPAPAKQESKPEPKSNGIITVDWRESPESPIVRGDIGEVVDMIQKHCTAKWEGDWWHILPKDVPTIAAMCRQLGYTFQEILPPSDGGPQVSGARHGAPERTTAVPTEARGKAGTGARAPSSSPSAPAVVSGVIDKVTAGMTSRNSPTRQVRIAGKWYTSYVNPIFEYLDKAIGKKANLLVDDRKNIVGIKNIGSREFDEDGRTPIIQRDEPRGGNLFEK